MATIIKYIKFFLIILIISCNNSTESTAEKFFMPDLDIFVVRSPLSSDTIGAERFETSSGETPDIFLQRVFSNRNLPSVNYFISKMGVSFYHSTIRIFYIKYDAGEINIYNFDETPSFTLTDENGANNKGTVYNEVGPFKLYLAGDTTPAANYAGLAFVGADGILMLSNSSNLINDDPFSQIFTHEMGHNFGLLHSFDDNSCFTQPQGTTDRIMDYSNSMSNFIQCEISIANYYASTIYNLDKITYDSSTAPNILIYKGDWDGELTVGSPITSRGIRVERPEVTVD